METTKKYLLVLTGIAGLFAGTGQEARAAFELNFLPSPDRIAGSDSTEVTFNDCGRPGATAGTLTNSWCYHGGGGASGTPAPEPDNTAFLREYVSVAGVTYAHMIVGSLTPDAKTGEVFAQEIYIRANSAAGSGAGTVYSSSGGKPGCLSNLLSVCGGQSVGANVIPWQSGNGQIASINTVGDPLSGNQHLTGNATGNPTQVIIRQVLKSDGRSGTPDISQEFLKTSLLLKPKISQTTSFVSPNGAVMSDEFVLDMSAIDYNTNASGVMTNKFTTNDPDMPQLSRVFDAVASAQFSDVSGGQYIFTSGTGWVDNAINSSFARVVPCVPVDLTRTCTSVTPADEVWLYDQGKYTYARGGTADLFSNLNWKNFKNPLINPVVPVIP